MLHSPQILAFRPPPIVVPAVPSSTFDPSVTASDIVLSNGNLTAAAPNSFFSMARGSTGYASGKLYFEVLIDGYNINGDVFIGVMDDTTTSPASLAGTYHIANSVGMRDDSFAGGNTGFTAGTLGSGGVGTTSVSDVYQCAVDIGNKKVWMGRNNTWANSGDPAAGTNAAATWSASYTLYPQVAIFQTGTSVTFRPTSGSQSFSPPSGFTAWG